MLHNIKTGSDSLFLSFSQIAEFFEDVGITNSATNMMSFAQWNGTENVFYLTDKKARWTGEPSYLIQLGRPEPMLRLLSKNFKYNRLSSIDPAGGKEIHGGRVRGTNSDGVFIQDLVTGEERTLLAPEGSTQYSLPAVYKNTVIYIRSNAVWQLDRTTTNSTRLFPPP